MKLKGHLLRSLFRISVSPYLSETAKINDSVKMLLLFFSILKRCGFRLWCFESIWLFEISTNFLKFVFDRIRMDFTYSREELRQNQLIFIKKFLTRDRRIFFFNEKKTRFDSGSAKLRTMNWKRTFIIWLTEQSSSQIFDLDHHNFSFFFLFFSKKYV